MDSVPMNHHQHHHNHHHSLGGDYDKSMTNSSSYSVWNNFFLSAGIPDTVANEYAVTFSQHRIRIDMLKEITKEILLDMGIKAMGDIIAILRHAKNLYTQDELKGGSIKAPNPVCVSNTIMPPQRQAVMDGQITQRTPITSTRQGPSISSLVGGKIQSRVSLNSGALIASSNNSTQAQSESKHKRPPSTLSTSMAKRLCPAAVATTTVAKLDAGISLPEKTLTVHYPSGAAIAKAQQRVLAGSGSSVAATSLTRNSTSLPVKSRLGSGPAVDSGKFRSDSTTTRTNNSSNNNNINNSNINNNNNNSSSRKGWSSNVKNGSDPRTSTFKSSPSNNRRPDNRRQSQHNDDRDEVGHQQQHKGRLKSTVFNRLGDGAR